MYNYDSIFDQTNIYVMSHSTINTLKNINKLNTLLIYK